MKAKHCDECINYIEVSMLELRLRNRIDELERWIAAIADDHPQIPEWIHQSARSLLAGMSREDAMQELADQAQELGIE
jgi:uncharacterized protein YigA (DUF484 family)